MHVTHILVTQIIKEAKSSYVNSLIWNRKIIQFCVCQFEMNFQITHFVSHCHLHRNLAEHSNLLGISIGAGLYF